MNRVRKLTFCGVLIALTVVMTMVVKIPTPGGKGFFNLGDMVLIFSGLTFGGGIGFIVGGIGSALADLLLGYTIYAPATFVIKGLEGLVAGIIYFNFRKKHEFGGKVLAVSVAAVVMTCGYFIYESFMFGLAVAIPDIPTNLMQGFLGAIVAFLVHTATKRYTGQLYE